MGAYAHEIPIKLKAATAQIEIARVYSWMKLWILQESDMMYTANSCENSSIFIQENAFENIDCKMANHFVSAPMWYFAICMTQ